MNDDWTIDGRSITSTDRLSAIRAVLENVGPVIVEHWHYYGSCAPDRVVFEDYDTLLDYLTKNAKPGDAFHVWDFAAVCQNGNTLTSGKYPDAEGRTPKGGAY